MGIVQRGNIGGVSGTRDCIRTGGKENEVGERNCDYPMLCLVGPGMGAVHRRSVPRAAQDRNGVREVWKT